MDAMLKHMEVRDDGFLEVVLKRTKDFDEYIFQQIHKDEHCLLCVRDPRSKTRLYYDTKGYLTLKEYLQAHLFAERELLPFLLYVLEDMVQVNAGKPVSMRLEHVFLSYDGGLLRFLVFPLVVDNWLFQKEELKQFLKDLLDCVRVTQDFAALGFLGYCLRSEDLTLPQVLQGLHDLQAAQAKPLGLLEKLFHITREEPFQVRDLPAPKTMAVPSFAIEEESGGYAVQKELESPTQELLAQDCSCLVDLKSWNSIRVDKAQFTIGRAKDNDLVLSGKTISQHHACIEEGVLKDCGSANGTYINGERITSRELKDQDVIRFANLQFRWQKEEIV